MTRMVRHANNQLAKNLERSSHLQAEQIFIFRLTHSPCRRLKNLFPRDQFFSILQIAQ